MPTYPLDQNAKKSGGLIYFLAIIMIWINVGTLAIGFYLHEWLAFAVNANSIRAIEMEDARLEFELKTLRNQLFDTDTCNKCGQKLPNAKDIETHNERLDRLIRAVKSKRAVLVPKMGVEERDKARLKEIASHAASYTRADQLR